MKLILIYLLLNIILIRGETNKFVFDSMQTGKVAPLLPEEYVTNFIQHKWNNNGFSISHISLGNIWSSFSRKIVRVDSAQHDWKSDNATTRGPRSGSIQISIFDFTRTDGLVNNIIYNKESMKRKPVCNNYTLTRDSAVIQVFPANFLRVSNAMFTGQELMNDYGLCDKWVVFFDKVPVTFYFNGTGKWVRVDFIGPPTKASVVNYFFNMDSEQKLDSEVFEGFNECES